MRRGTYEVGYKKPPRNKQFQKGVSGNLGGRPRSCKTLSMLDVFGGVLSKKTVISENGRHIKITLFEALCRRVVTDAINGKPQAARLMYTVVKEYNKLHMEYGRTDVDAQRAAMKIIGEIYKEISGTSTSLPKFTPEQFQR